MLQNKKHKILSVAVAMAFMFSNIGPATAVYAAELQTPATLKHRPCRQLIILVV